MVKSEVRERVLRRVNEERDSIVAFTQALVKVPSIGGSLEEGRAQKLVEKEFRAVDGLEVEVWEPNVEDLQRYPLHPIRLTPWSYRDRPNVIGKLNGVGGGRSLILNGHVDVVSPEPIEAWKHDPWGAEVEEGRLYGRGALDMKGGLAAITYAARCITEAGIKLRGNLILQSVVEEEYGGGGSLAAVLGGCTADAVIISEPTGVRDICVGCAGSRFFKVKILGKSEVAGRAHLGVNAIGLTYKIYNALLDMDVRRAERLRGKHRLFEEAPQRQVLSGSGRPTNLTLGVLKAGDWPSTVAGWAELEGRIGFPPSERGIDVEVEVEAAVKSTAESDPWMRDHPPKVVWWGARREGHELSLDTPIVETVKRYVEGVTGLSCGFFATPSACDACYFTPRIDGYGGIPCILYGPGGAGIHATDEYLDLEDLMTVIKVLSLSILDWCGYEG